MALNQINLKVDDMLYEHIQKKSIRNKISNQEYLKTLVKDDFNTASEGDLELLNRYGDWATKKVVQKLHISLPELIAETLQDSEEKVATSLQLLSQKTSEELLLIRNKIKENRSFASATYSATESLPDSIKKMQRQSEILYRNQLQLKKLLVSQLVVVIVIILFQMKEVFL